MFVRVLALHCTLLALLGETASALRRQSKKAKAAATTWGLETIGASGRGRSGGKATIFIIDTGVRVTHKDFGGRAVPALDMNYGEPIECNGDLSCAADIQGLGTHIAGSAAGASFGVAPAAAVRSIKVFGDKDGHSRFRYFNYALEWVAQTSARPAVATIRDMNWGQRLEGTDSFQVAVDKAVNSGVVVVVAAGNMNSDACGQTAGLAPSAITVGATDSNNKRVDSSNYGRCVDLWAPSRRVTSAGHKSDTATYDASWDLGLGASAYVAGAAALVLDADPSMSAQKVLAELQATAAIGQVRDLTLTDTNALLYVGEGGAPPAPTVPPTSCPRQCRILGAGLACGRDLCKNRCSFCFATKAALVQATTTIQ